MIPKKIGQKPAGYYAQNPANVELIASINSIVDAVTDLDERIARFETGAAYERREMVERKEISGILRQVRHVYGFVDDPDYMFRSIDELKRLVRDGLDHVIEMINNLED